MRWLRINADDFGLTAGVTRGIVQSMREGAVHTTSAMMCAIGSPQHIAAHCAGLGGRVGLHLQLTGGRALSGPSQLTDTSGHFPRGGKNLGEVCPQAVLAEWRLQLQAFRKLRLEPSHLDTHHDVHWRPGALEAYIDLAREESLPVRSGPPWLAHRLRAAGLRCAAVTRTLGDRAAITLDGFLEEACMAAAECAEGDWIELGCHPGFTGEELRAQSVYVEQRTRELEVLCDPALAGRLRQAGIELTPTWPPAGEH